MNGDEAVTLVGGPCDGEKLPLWSAEFLHIPISQGGPARFGEVVEEVAVYRLDITGLRANYVQRNQA